LSALKKFTAHELFQVENMLERTEDNAGDECGEGATGWLNFNDNGVRNMC
jgi:hypothetical protein